MVRTGTRKLAFGGILLALFMALMYLDSIFPLLDRSFLILGSFFVMAAIMELGKSGGIVFYIAAAVLGLALLPDKSGIILFILFFGLYPLEKYFAELIPSRLLQLLAKLLMANVSLAVLLLAYKAIFMDILPENLAGLDWSSNLMLLVILLLYQAFVIFYDWFLSLFAAFYRKKISGRLRIGS